MITFWILAIVLFALVSAYVVYPLFKSHADKAAEIVSDADQKQINIDIAREKLAQLQAEHDNHQISDEEFEALKYELETSLIDDIDKETDSDQGKASTACQEKTNWGLLLAVAVFLPVFTLLMYQQLGRSEFIEGVPDVPKQVTKETSINQMILGLINKLKENPNDERGWFLLAKTFMATERYDEAYKVYEKLLSLTGEDADVLVSMADALAMSKGGRLTADAEALLKRALKIAPQHRSGLWLSGMAARERGDTQEALSYWYKLYPLLDDDESKQTVAEMISASGGKVPDEAYASMQKQFEQILQEEVGRQQKQSQSETAATQAAVRVEVELDPNLKTQVSENDLVFIYAKALSGPPMPLAAARLKVSDLPVSLVLDDGMAMMPAMKISAHDQVKVGARVSKSGRPIKQPGDLISNEQIVPTRANDKTVKIVINSVYSQ